LSIPALATLGFTGGILHVLNHSLFKSLLFYTAGSVNQQTHTRHIEHLGGLIKTMPKTAYLFLLGALAICGLPPFNGFISEFLIFSGLFKGLKTGGLTIDLIILGTFTGLTLIGGLAVFCFTKVFSIVFLGTPRTEAPRQAHEVGTSMLIPKIAAGLLILLIGIIPSAFVGPANRVAQIFTGDPSMMAQTTATLSYVSLASLLFIGLIIVLWNLRSAQQKKATVGYGPTWGCGYSGADPARHQYTANSFAESYREIVGPVANMDEQYNAFREAEIFPGPRKFATHGRDFLEDYLVSRPVRFLTFWLEKSAVLQTGKLQHYVLYALVFLISIFLFTFFKFI
jgi:NADH:ubiquinone oxidoreductase subunit 5 (subunit L)/multisubunit Na+/H+ antiporter MnhA subunit